MASLITGGTGFIGSHTVVELLNDGRDVVILDNLSNSKECVIDRIETITGKRPKFYNADLLDYEAVDRVFNENDIDSVIHFAGLKAVGESVAQPIRYYHNNLTGTLILCDVMAKHNVKLIVFSSSATVYGNPSKMPITEDFPLSTTNPYGTTKLMLEQILKDAAKADTAFNPVILRYFNPVGAHESGRIGEDPNGIPNNLMPYISQVAIGKLEKLNVFGGDYDTKDGTGVRDFIHVVDLAKGHVAALKKFETPCGLQIYNLGTGQGYSVLEMLHAFEKAVGKKIPYEVVARRPGDIPVCYADPEKAAKELNWHATKNINDMCADTWRWQTMNPNGYDS